MPITKETILRALALADGDRDAAAKALGCSRGTLYRWLAANPGVAPEKPPGPRQRRRHRLVIAGTGQTVDSLAEARRIAQDQGCEILRSGTVVDASGAAIGSTRALFDESGDGP